VRYKLAKQVVLPNYTPLNPSAFSIVSVRERSVEKMGGLESGTGEMGHGQAAGRIHSLRSKVITPWLSYSMQQGLHWEANRFSASQEIPRIPQNPKIHYRIHKCPPPISIPSRINPIPAPSHFLKIYLNIILPSTPGISKWYLSLMFSHHIPVYTSSLSHTCCMLRPSHSSRFDHPNNIW